MSAPLFLLLTLVISHLLEMALHLHPLQRVGHGAEKLFGSDQNLILLRALMFAIFPLMFALEQVRASDQALTRKSLRGPFFGECYPAAVFCLVFGIGGTLLQTSPNLAPLGVGIMILAVAWYVTVQAVWLHRFKRSWGRAVCVSAGCFLKGAVFLSLAAIAVGIAVLA